MRSALPSNLNPQLITSDKGVLLKPLLLNPGDGFFLEVVASTDIKLISSNGRVSGIRAIAEYKQEQFSGLSIEKVVAKGFGQTRQSHLVRLPAYSIALTCFACISLVVVALPLRRAAKGPFGRIFLGLLVFLVYLVGAVAAALLPSAFLADDAPTWARYLLLALSIALSLTAGLRSRRLYQLNSQSQALPTPVLQGDAKSNEGGDA